MLAQIVRRHEDRGAFGDQPTDIFGEPWRLRLLPGTGVG
jgi:hypothetical protein